MLNKKYDHLSVEKDKYDNWKKKDYFKLWLLSFATWGCPPP